MALLKALNQKPVLLFCVRIFSPAYFMSKLLLSGDTKIKLIILFFSLSVLVACTVDHTVTYPKHRLFLYLEDQDIERVELGVCSLHSSFQGSVKIVEYQHFGCRRDHSYEMRITYADGSSIYKNEGYIEGNSLAMSHFINVKFKEINTFKMVKGNQIIFDHRE